LAAITNRSLPFRNNLARVGVAAWMITVLKAVMVLVVARRAEIWPLALVLVAAAEMWPLRANTKKVWGVRLLDRMPALLVGLSVVVIVAVSPRLLTQAVAAGLYAIWQIWWAAQRRAGAEPLTNLLLVQVAVFEAIFLMSAVWRETPTWLVLILVWLGAYLSVYAALARRGERSAGVMAATWAVIAVEVAWVLLLWLYVYTIGAGYVLVPQPALILTAMAYCFGSIYVSQREGTLSRTRLAEYLVIGLVLIGIVVVGTSWRGNL
jgi:hypothetical protein